MCVTSQLLAAEGEDGVLLAQVQQYLLCRSQKRTPATFLVEAWTRFYAAWSGPIKAMVKSHPLDRDDAEDVTQSVWLKVVQKLPAFRWDETRGGLRAWLSKLVQRTALDLWRHKGRHPAKSLDQCPGAAPEPARWEDDPALLFESGCDRELVRGVLAKMEEGLPPENVRIIQLRYFEEKSESEVAGELGLTPVQLRNRLYRVRRRIQAALIEVSGEEFRPPSR